METKTRIIHAEHRVTGNTNCVTKLIIEESACFVNIACLPDKKILITKTISKNIQDHWENGNSINLVVGSFSERQNGILTADPINIEIINPMDDIII